MIRHLVISNILRGAASGKFVTALYAKPIEYQYRRFKTVD